MSRPIGIIVSMPRAVLHVLRFVWMLAFMVGAMGMVLAAAYVWLYLIIAATDMATPIGGILVVALSFWFIVRYQDSILFPWRFWFALWRYVDDGLN